MSIREYNKDQLGKHKYLDLAPMPLQAPIQEDPLLFWTEHPTENFFVDLRPFRDGVFEKPVSGTWVGPYSGRPNLIWQLAPVLQASMIGLTSATAGNQLNSLRRWWRVLDTVEEAAAKADQPMDRVDDVRQLTEIHRQWAHASGMNRMQFQNFLQKVNPTLAALGVPQLHWKAPEDDDPRRHLPPEWQIKVWRNALKQEWFKVLNRWQKTDKLLAGELKATTEEDVILLKNYQYYQAMQQKVGKAFLTLIEVADDISPQQFWHKSENLAVTVMRAGFFPDRWAADAAYHQCLAMTGWNSSTLLSLNASEDFLLTHPKDDMRFILTPGNGSEGNGETYELTGTKSRSGGAEQRVFGLWKTKFGAGYIINTYLDRVAPLRIQLQQEYAVEKARYAEMKSAGAGNDCLIAQYKKVIKLEAGCRSVWLYQDLGGIKWLNKKSNGFATVNGKIVSYMPAMAHKINAQRDEGEKIEAIKASDLRDAFALWSWRASGGNIFVVMKALQHRSIRSTSNYIDNNILNDENNQLYRQFSNHLFGELANGRLDVTILTHLCRYGSVSEEMRQRLEEYRTLMRSRYGIACKDPFHPPKTIAPVFVPDGKRVCSLQRCLLCKSHAILLPESIDGISQRAEELCALQVQLPIEMWISSKFQVELDNTLEALQLFDPAKVRECRTYWSEAILTGKHVVPGVSLINQVDESA